MMVEIVVVVDDVIVVVVVVVMVVDVYVAVVVAVVVSGVVVVQSFGPSGTSGRPSQRHFCTKYLTASKISGPEDADLNMLKHSVIPKNVELADGPKPRPKNRAPDASTIPRRSSSSAPVLTTVSDNNTTIGLC